MIKKNSFILVLMLILSSSINSLCLVSNDNEQTWIWDYDQECWFSPWGSIYIDEEEETETETETETDIIEEFLFSLSLENDTQEIQELRELIHSQRRLLEREKEKEIQYFPKIFCKEDSRPYRNIIHHKYYDFKESLIDKNTHSYFWSLFNKLF